MPIQFSPQGLKLQQQAMGMPPDQVQALLNQQVGLIPLPELLAIKRAVDRAQLRDAPSQAQPDQTTVAQDLMIQKGTQDRMQSGVAALPVNNVGNETAYAGGGIVAFAGDGPYGSFVDMDVLSNYGLGSQSKRMFGPFERPPVQTRRFSSFEQPSPKDREQQEEVKPKLEPPKLTPAKLSYMKAPTEAEFGITPELEAAANRSQEERMADLQKSRGEDILAKQETRVTGELEKRTGKAAETKDMWLALSQGFFQMAASGKPTFTGALAAGAERGFEAYRQAIAKRDDLKDRYQEKLDAIARAKQAQAEGDYRYAASERRADIKELNDLRKDLAASQRATNQFNAGVSNEAAMQAERLASQANQAQLDRESRERIAQADAVAEALRRLQSENKSLYTSARTIVLGSIDPKLAKGYADGDPDATAKVEQEILKEADRSKRGMANLGSGNIFQGAPSTSGYAGFSSEIVGK